MTTEQFLSIKQGDADTLTDTITGLDSLTDYQAKMYIYKSDGTAIDTITGTVSGLTVTYELVNESTKDYPVGTYDFECKVWDSSDHVYSDMHGVIEVRTAHENDPS